MVCMADFLGVERFGVAKNENHMQIKGQCVYVKKCLWYTFYFRICTSGIGVHNGYFKKNCTVLETLYLRTCTSGSGVHNGH